MFKIIKILCPLLLIFLFASILAFGVEDYGNVGPTTEFDFDIKISDEIIAEGSSADEHETTILFTDPTADRTITIPDADATIGVATSLDPAIIHGLDADTLADADEFVFYDDTGSHLNKITWTNLMGSIIKVGVIGTGAWEATDVGIAHGGTGVSTGAMVNFTSMLNVALYVGRDGDNQISWAVDDTLTIEIAGVVSSIVDIETGAGDNDSLVTQGYCDDNAAAGGANVALSNLAGVAINTSLIPDAADTDDLGSATFEWLTIYLGTYGTIYFGVGQTEWIAETAVNSLEITATDGVTFTGEIWTTEVVGIGRDTDNYIGWGVDDSLAIKIGGVAHAFVSISTGVGDNDKLCTQGYADDIAGGATIELDNLGVVALNTSLISDTADTDDLGSATFEFRSVYVGTVGKIYMGLTQEIALEVTDANTLYITASANVSLSGGLIVAGTVALAANNITMTGSIGVTGSRVTKLWTTDLESTNDITIGGTALAAIYSPIAGSASIVTVGTVGTGTWEATDVGLAHGGTGVSTGAMVNFTSILNVALYVGRDADNQIKFATDNKIIFRFNTADRIEMISTGELDMNAGTIGFTLQTATGDGTTTIDWKLGNKFKFTFGAQNDTLTFTAPTNPCHLWLHTVQDGVGGRTITWPGTCKWPNSIEPTMSTAAAAEDMVALWWDGTNYHCAIAFNYGTP